MSSRLSSEELDKQFIAAVGTAAVVSASTDAAGELVVELLPPLPRRVRVYLYNATNPPGGRPTPEHKIQLMVAGQRKGERANFDWSDVDLVLLCGYVSEYDVFAFWDASLHRNFAHSTNLQIKTAIVKSAAASDSIQRQDRRLKTGPEVVICVPRQLVPAAIEERALGGGSGPQPGGRSTNRGRSYTRPPRDSAAQTKSLVFDVDPDVMDRGTNAHKNVQDQLADAVSARGWQPLSPGASDPQFDVAWIAGRKAWITEVKSITDSNEERQLRLGLGQVLSYAYLVDWGMEANCPVLAVEREPSEPYWPEFCRSHGVALSWPEMFTELLDSCD